MKEIKLNKKKPKLITARVSEETYKKLEKICQEHSETMGFICGAIVENVVDEIKIK